MEKWIVFGLCAALFLGAANLPQSIAPTKTTGYEVLFFSGLASMLVGLISWWLLAPDDAGFTRAEASGYLWSLLAGLLLAGGSLFIVLAFAHGGSPAVLPAIFNTNTVVAFTLSLLLIPAARHALYAEDGSFDTLRFAKLCLGIALVVGGAILVAMNSQRKEHTTTAQSEQGHTTTFVAQGITPHHKHHKHHHHNQA